MRNAACCAGDSRVKLFLGYTYSCTQHILFALYMHLKSLTLALPSAVSRVYRVLNL